MALRRCLQPWLQQNMYLIEQRVPQAAWAYSSSSSKPEQQQDKQQQHVAETQQQQASPAAAPSQSTTSDTLATAASRPKGAEEWTEVIDEKSGQTYYWNEKTGETTDLGEPRPKTRFRDQEWEQAAKQGPFQEGWREPPGRDHTYFYSVVGVAIGIAAGWVTQYLH